MKYFWHMYNRMLEQWKAGIELLPMLDMKGEPLIVGVLGIVAMVLWIVFAPFAPLIAILRFPFDTWFIAKEIRTVTAKIEAMTTPEEVSQFRRKAESDMKEYKDGRDFYVAEKFEVLLPIIERQLTITTIGFKNQ